MVGKTKQTLCKLFCGQYNSLLGFLFLMFIFRPHTHSDIYLGIWKFLLAVVCFCAVFNCNHPRSIKIITGILAVPSIILSWFNLFHNAELVFVANAVVTVVFLLICTGSIVYDVVVKARVTLETLRGVICAYFMVAFVFGYIYYLIEFITPGSFQLLQQETFTYFYTQYLSEMLYFSFITLLTIGYGDIVAVKEVGQTAVVIEGIIGQFYIAILVARLVSVYSFYSDKKLRSIVKE